MHSSTKTKRRGATPLLRFKIQLESEERKIYHRVWENREFMFSIIRTVFPCTHGKEEPFINVLNCMELVRNKEELKEVVRVILYDYLKKEYPDILFKCLMVDENVE